MKVKDTPEVSSKVAIAENEVSKVRTAFFAERESFQTEIETLAKHTKQDKFAVYAAILFGQRLNDRYEYAQTKQAKVKLMALEILKSSGMDEVEARQRLGLGDK